MAEGKAGQGVSVLMTTNLYKWWLLKKKEHRIKLIVPSLFYIKKSLVKGRA